MSGHGPAEECEQKCQVSSSMDRQAAMKYLRPTTPATFTCGVLEQDANTLNCTLLAVVGSVEDTIPGFARVHDSKEDSCDFYVLVTSLKIRLCPH